MKSFYFYLTFLVFATCKLEISASTRENQAFLDGHNSRRLKVAKGEVKGQPSAAKMNIMMWDDELFKKASDYAKTFATKHNPNKKVPSGRFSGTGENLYWYSTTDRNYKLNPDVALESWFSEHENYTYTPIHRSDFDGSHDYHIGHYTQMVWSDSIYVGCATSQKYEAPWNKFFVVCNYGPPGNYIGEVPYKKGGPSYKLICGCGKGDRNCDCN